MTGHAVPVKGLNRQGSKGASSRFVVVEWQISRSGQGNGMNRTINVPGLEAALEQIRAPYDVNSVRVFGSVARSGTEAAHDLDVGILLDSRSRRMLEITRDMRQVLFRAVDRPVDLLVYDKTDFQDRESAGASFERTISREGVPV